MRFADISRTQAFLSHLFVSTLIFLVLSYLIVFQWYPSFYFEMDGGLRAITTIFFVDIVLGPGLTLLVFKPGKKSLKFDMTAIIVFQLIALSWGIKSVYEDRPALTVFYLGKFSCMTQAYVDEVDMESIERGVSGKQKLALLRSPDTVAERNRFRDKAFEAESSEIYYYGSLYEPLGGDNINRLMMYNFDLDILASESRKSREKIDNYLKDHPGLLDRYRLYPVNSRFRNAIAVFDPESVRIVDIIDVGTRVRAMTEEAAKRSRVEYQSID